jgi:hypothetical protein
MASESWPTLFGVALRRLRLALREGTPVSQSEFGRRIGFDHSTVSAIERAIIKPDEQFVEACERELPSHGVLRSMLPFVIAEWEEWKRLGVRKPVSDVPQPAELTLTTSDLMSAEFLEAAAEDATEAVELARLAETSSIAAGSLDTLDETVDRFARDYPHAPPALLIPRVKRQLRYIKHLLGTSVTLAQRRHLIIDGGWLALLLACLQFDIGNKPAAEASRDAAYQLGREGGHQELIAWTYELLAWFALVEGAYPSTIDNARAGRALAPHTSAGVQLAVQEAKAWAKLRDRAGAEEAMRQGGAALSRLPTPSHPDHHFIFDGSKLSFYAATVYVWLGALDRAEEHALHVIEQCITGDGVGRWPTRLAVAHIDLGLIAVQRREYAEAAERGVLALGAGRVVASTMGWVEELDTALRHLQPSLAEVHDFHERYLFALRSL